MASTRDEIVVEACSLSIPKMVGGPSKRFHEKINPLGYYEPPNGQWLLELASGLESVT
jgi:hypothetical protein